MPVVAFFLIIIIFLLTDFFFFLLIFFFPPHPKVSFSGASLKSRQPERQAPSSGRADVALLPAAVPALPAAPQALGLGASLGPGAPHTGNGLCDPSDTGGFLFFHVSF